MNTISLKRLSPQEAEFRRAQIIDAVGGSEDEFRARAEVYSLSAHELALFDELESIDYLLGR